MSEKWAALAERILDVVSKDFDRATEFSENYFEVEAGDHTVKVGKFSGQITFTVVDRLGTEIDVFTDDDLPVGTGRGQIFSSYANLMARLARHKSGADAAIDSIIENL